MDTGCVAVQPDSHHRRNYPRHPCSLQMHEYELCDDFPQYMPRKRRRLEDPCIQSETLPSQTKRRSSESSFLSSEGPFDSKRSATNAVHRVLDKLGSVSTHFESSSHIEKRVDQHRVCLGVPPLSSSMPSEKPQSFITQDEWNVLCQIPVVSPLFSEEETDYLSQERLRAQLRQAGKRECESIAKYTQQCMTVIQAAYPYPSTRRDRKIADLFWFLSDIYRSSSKETSYISDKVKQSGDVRVEAEVRTNRGNSRDVLAHKVKQAQHLQLGRSNESSLLVNPLLMHGFVESVTASDAQLQNLLGWKSPWVYEWGDCGMGEIDGVRYLRNLELPRAIEEDLLKAKHDAAQVRDLLTAHEHGVAQRLTETKMPVQTTTDIEQQTTTEPASPCHPYKLRARRPRRVILRSPFNEDYEESFEGDEVCTTYDPINGEQLLCGGYRISDLKKWGYPVRMTGDASFNQPVKKARSRGSRAKRKRAPSTHAEMGKAKSMETVCLQEPFVQQTSTGTESEPPGGAPRSPLPSQRLVFLMEQVKQISGWHPYQWYMMCRRPELETSGVDPQQVTLVCNSEWDMLQQDVASSALLTFLAAVLRFLEDNAPPPPTLDTAHPDLQNYLVFLASHVHTPNYMLITEAAQRTMMAHSCDVPKIVQSQAATNDTESTTA
eukprot:Blabericola_migrator_1__11204@NODE_657_length_7016_cov_177_727587_g481_i0_p1_GENE_NODE_657_length_7016_cov_177_727587_g481_i0NODE_657_length_7016_cov_177_727587_g481_i0_p1_ORF_typecomplete_len662_score77_44_NODE_657_length_7016_cov_177_727587_g481_i017293714